MDPIAVDISLIRMVVGDLRITPGRALMARVVQTYGTGRGALSIAGSLIDAELPPEVQAGQDLRLVVRHVSAERVVLGLSDQTPASASGQVPLPGGGSLRVSERDGSSAGGGAANSHVLTLRYDAPNLGPVDLRFELDPTSLRLAVAATPGDPLELVKDSADPLRQALTDSLDRAVSITVSARREPLDLYA